MVFFPPPPLLLHLFPRCLSNVLPVCAVLKLLRVASGIRALLDTISQALPQVIFECMNV